MFHIQIEGIDVAINLINYSISEITLCSIAYLGMSILIEPNIQTAKRFAQCKMAPPSTGLTNNLSIINSFREILTSGTYKLL